MVNEQRSFVDDLAFPRGCKFSSWLSSTRNWDLSWWMVLILVFVFLFLSKFCVNFYRKDIVNWIMVDQCTTKLMRKSKPNDKNLGYPSTEEQSNILPWLQGIGRHAIPILLEFQKSGYWPNSPYYWNSRNRSISKIGSTPGNTQIENFEISAYFWNSTNWETEIICYINGIP